MTIEETDVMKIKDLFEAPDMLSGRTEIDTQSKLNVGLIWSAPGSQFIPFNPDVDNVDLQSGIANTDGTGILFSCEVNLPHGATITGVIVYSSESDETYLLARNTLANGIQNIMAGSTNQNTEDTTISNPLVDNSTFCYYITTSTMDAGDDIFGARITYTI